jgi:nitrogen-specific signal transduction histidine kinase
MLEDIVDFGDGRILNMGRLLERFMNYKADPYKIYAEYMETIICLGQWYNEASEQLRQEKLERTRYENDLKMQLYTDDGATLLLGGKRATAAVVEAYVESQTLYQQMDQKVEQLTQQKQNIHLYIDLLKQAMKHMTACQYTDVTTEETERARSIVQKLQFDEE